MNTPDQPEQDLPTLSEAMNDTDVLLTNIRIPVLEDMVSRESIEQLVAQRLVLPPTLEQELTQRVTALVKQRLNETLPELLRIVQEEVTENVCKHISDSLPGIVEELLRNAAQPSGQRV